MSKDYRDYMLELSGPTFSPSAAAAKLGVAIESSQEPGALKRYGKGRGLPSPYGSGTLKYPMFTDGEPTGKSVLPFLALVERLLPELRALGAEDMSFWFVVGYEGQCNMEWDTEILQALARLGLTFCVSCYRVDPDAAE